MNTAALKQEMKDTYLDEYSNAIKEEKFFIGVKHFLRNANIGSLVLVAGAAGAAGALFYAGNAQLSATFTNITLVASVCGGLTAKNNMNVIARYIAKRNIRKDIKNGTLLTRYKNEIIPQKKKALRAEASAEVKIFEEKKRTRKEAFRALDEIVALPTEDFTAAFNKKSIRARVNTAVAKMASVEPLKNNKAR